MSRHHRTRAAILPAASFAAMLALGIGAALAQPNVPQQSNVHVDGRYHSVTNGIANYDGFDQFRDPKGQPLPGWEQVLRSPG